MALVLSRKLGPHVFHGATMLPFLVDGDEVEIEPVSFDQVRPGDIITYRDQQYFPTRRVIRIDRRSRSLILKGDAIPHLTFFVLEEDILGRATSIERGDRRLSAGDAEWRRTAEAVLARERRRAQTAWLPGWLGLGPPSSPAAAPGAEAAAAGRPGLFLAEPWWRTGRAAVDLDALQVVLALLAHEPDRAEWMLSRMRPRRFLDFARENGIAGDLVLHASDAGRGLSAVFDPIIGELIESARGQRTINHKVMSQLDAVSTLLERAGVETIVLKGPHLSLGYYGSLDQRRMGDLDLLVRGRDLAAAGRALVEAGYAARTGAPLGMRATLRFVHHLEYERDGVPVDLHHQIRVHPTFRFDEDELWAATRRLDLERERGEKPAWGDLRVRVLSHEHVLLTLILSAHNDIGLGTADLHSFFDLERVLSRVGDAIDWDAFFAARRRERTDAIAVNVLALHRVLMGAGDRHPALMAAIEARSNQLVLAPDRRAYFALIRGASLAAKKRWAFSQLATNLPAATLWWLIGLPVHAVVYRRIFFRDFGERLAVGRAGRGHGGRETRAAARRARRRAAAIATPPRRSALGAIGLDSGALPAMAVRPMRLGSLQIELHSDRPFAAEVLEELFRLEGTRRDAAVQETPEVRVRVFDATLDDLHRMVPPPIAPIVRRDLEGIFEVHHKAASAIMIRPREPGQPVEVAIPIRPASTISGRGAAEPDHPMLVHSLMIVFYRMLLELGCLHLHAAAVELDGAASLFLGGKGAGKSTVSLALGQAGATILAEDHVMVRRRGAALAVSGCDANMRLTEKTEAELMSSPPTGRRASFGGVVKREFDLRETALVARPFADSTPRRIFFPAVGRRYTVAPITRAEDMVRILGSVHDRHAIHGATDARRLLDLVFDLAASIEAYDLELSPDLRDLGALADFVAGRGAEART
jgi:hypothetical protein